MANVNDGYGQLSLLDISRRKGYNGTIMKMVEVLNQTNHILLDIPFIEGNMKGGTLVNIRTGLPEIFWTGYYDGVMPTKGASTQVEERAGRMKSLLEVDAELADDMGGVRAVMESEARGHIESMGQELARNLFFGDQSKNPSRITGLKPRYDRFDANNNENIIDASEVFNFTVDPADNSAKYRDIWIVVWGEDTVMGFYPEGAMAGLQRKYMGSDTLEDASMGGKLNRHEGRLEILREKFMWYVGFCVKDWRYAVRIANVPTGYMGRHPTENSGSKTTLADKPANIVQMRSVLLPDLFDLAVEVIPSLSTGMPVAYMDRHSLALYGRQLADGVESSTLTIKNVGSVNTKMVDGITLRRCDQLAVDSTMTPGLNGTRPI